jgi:hypothetical protein
MNKDTKMKWDFAERIDRSRRNLLVIRGLIEGHLWCPPARTSEGIRECGLCGHTINLNKNESSFYAVWVGLICGRCSRLFEREITELSKL